LTNRLNDVNIHTNNNIYTHKERIVRTNIIIDDELIDQARRLSGLKTKRAIVEEALKMLISSYEQAEVRNLRGKLRWEGDLDKLRENRFEPLH
jgi:Arc/MetJ family transcription regulator